MTRFTSQNMFSHLPRRLTVTVGTGKPIWPFHQAQILKTSLVGGKHVGKLVKAEGYVWYSFPQGGAWSLQRKIGSLALQEVYEFLRKPPRHQMNLSDQASQLETLFQEKFTY